MTRYRAYFFLLWIAFALAGWLGGAANPGEVELLRRIVAFRLAHPDFGKALVWFTQFGSAPVLLLLTALVAVGLLIARRWQKALFLFGTVVSGRIAIELIKDAVERPRPTLVPYPVHVSSLSFPSGHAGNSMLTFTAIALALAPPASRGAALAVAIVGSLAIGMTRPLLGVHWPTDVLGGWAFGLGWVMLCAMLVRQRAETAA